MMESAFDLDMTLNLILLNVHEHSGCQICAVYLRGGRQTLELRAASGPRDRCRCCPRSLSRMPARTAGLVPTPLQSARMSAPSTPPTRQVARSTSRLFEIDDSAGSFACLPLVGLEGPAGDAVCGLLISRTG